MLGFRPYRYVANPIRIHAEDAITDFGLHRNVRPVQNAEELVELLRSIL